MRAKRRSRREAGFTLVELIVVIAIVGLASAMVVLAIPDSGGNIRTEAERLAARAKAARDDAIIASRPVVLTLDANGYRIGRSGSVDVRQFAWRAGTQAEARPATTRFDPTGLADPMRIRLSRDGRTAFVEIAADGGIDVGR